MKGSFFSSRRLGPWWGQVSGMEKDPDFRLPKPSVQGLRGREHTAAAFLLRTTSLLTKTAYDPLGFFTARKRLKSRSCLGWKAAAACSQPLRPCALLLRAKVRAVFRTAPWPLPQASPLMSLFLSRPFAHRALVGVLLI